MLCMVELIKMINCLIIILVVEYDFEFILFLVCKVIVFY